MAERGAPASNPAANERPRGVLPSLQRALLVTLLLAGLRAAFVLLRDDYLAGGLWGHALRSFSRHLLLGGIMGFAPLLVLLFLGTTARARVGRWAGWLVVVPGAVGLYLFASLRWPSYPHYAPGWESLPGWVANGIAASVALVGAALLIWDARLPLRRSLVGAACAAFASAAGVYLLAPTTNRTGKPNLILISLDTLRRDHLGCYGYERPTSPELDAFAARSLRFTESFAPQPWTLTSHMSMLTGLYPSAHDLEEDRALPFGVRTLS